MFICLGCGNYTIKRKRNTKIYILVFFFIAHIFESIFYVPIQCVMICHKEDLITCFRSDVNVTFVFFNNLRLKYRCLSRFKHKQGQSIAWCLYKQKTTKMFGKYCLAVLLVDVFSLLHTPLHTHYAQLGRDLFVSCANVLRATLCQ